jgi:putative methyltransferase (TIGR04325 family)
MRQVIRKIPFSRQLYLYLKKPAYKRQFSTNCYGCFWEVFDTFEQARQAAPLTKDIGYDNADLAKEYRQMFEADNWENSGRIIASYDYPVLLWLKYILNNENAKIFDFGGNVGIHFYAYSKYLIYPEKLEWTVCELPEIIEVGRDIASERDAQQLFFTSDFKDVDDKNILIASGSIQYVENLANQLSCLRKPEHLLINRLPLYDGNKFVTLQNGGKVFYPQYVFNRSEFISEMTDIGYELIDAWQDTADGCIIPFYPEKSVPTYSGLYLRLKS